MDNERDNLTAVLTDIAQGSRRTKIARLTEIFDEVEAAKAAGASNKTIVHALAQYGLIFDVNNFKNACSRIRKQRAMDALAKAVRTPPGPAGSPPATTTLPASGVPQPQGKQQEKVPGDVASTGSNRPTIRKDDKGLFAGLKPDPVDGQGLM